MMAEKKSKSKLADIRDDFPLGDQGPQSQEPKLKWEPKPIKVVDRDSELS